MNFFNQKADNFFFFVQTELLISNWTYFCTNFYKLTNIWHVPHESVGPSLDTMTGSWCVASIQSTPRSCNFGSTFSLQFSSVDWCYWHMHVEKRRDDVRCGRLWPFCGSSNGLSRMISFTDLVSTVIAPISFNGGQLLVIFCI